MVKFVVVGSLNYDLVSYTSRVPFAGETFQADAFETHIGGKGLNQTISLAKLLHDPKSSVKVIGKVGDDSFGTELTSALEKFGVDTTDVEVLKGLPSGVAVIMVESDTGENRILITAGANGKSIYTDSELEVLFSESEEQHVVVFQNEIPGTADVITWLHSNRPNANIVYNPSPYYSYSAPLVPLTDILIVNEGEAMAIAKDILPSSEYDLFSELIKKEQIGGYTQLSQTLQSKLNSKNSQTVVITLGSSGSLFTSKENSGFIPSVKVEKVVDTTGAGDTFLGAFTTQLFTGSDAKEALIFATKASSMAIQKNGASDSIPTFEEVAKLA